MRGQIFSLDYAISIVLMVIALGMLLNFYELNTYQIQENSEKTEITLIAYTASETLLKEMQCQLENDFGNQGFEFIGCAKTSDLSSIQKNSLLIPNTITITKDGTEYTKNVKCNIKVENDQLDACNDTIPREGTVISIERKFIEKNNTVSKSEWEDCITGDGCAEKTLSVKVWIE